MKRSDGGDSGRVLERWRDRRIRVSGLDLVCLAWCIRHHLSPSWPDAHSARGEKPWRFLLQESHILVLSISFLFLTFPSCIMHNPICVRYRLCECNKYIRFHVPSETRQQVKIQFKCNNKRKDEAGNVHLQGTHSANSGSFSASDENLKAGNSVQVSDRHAHHTSGWSARRNAQNKTSEYEKRGRMEVGRVWAVTVMNGAAVPEPDKVLVLHSIFSCCLSLPINPGSYVRSFQLKPQDPPLKMRW